MYVNEMKKGCKQSMNTISESLNYFKLLLEIANEEEEDEENECV